MGLGVTVGLGVGVKVGRRVGVKVGLGLVGAGLTAVGSAETVGYTTEALSPPLLAMSLEFSDSRTLAFAF